MISKKGSLSEMAANLLWYTLWAFIIVVFIFFLNTRAISTGQRDKADVIHGNLKDNTNTIVLLNYLRALPTECNVSTDLNYLEKMTYYEIINFFMKGWPKTTRYSYRQVYQNPQDKFQTIETEKAFTYWRNCTQNYFHDPDLSVGDQLIIRAIGPLPGETEIIQFPLDDGRNISLITNMKFTKVDPLMEDPYYE